MAASVSHLVVGDKVLRALGSGAVADETLFLCGNLAPDAIHQKDGYVRDDKRRTHLTEGVTGDMLGQMHTHAMLQARYRAFSHTLAHRAPASLWSGYLCHLITDELYNRTVRTQFVKRLGEDGIHPSDRAFFHAVMSAMDAVDRVLARTYPFQIDPMRVLNAAYPFDAGDTLPADMLTGSRAWVRRQYFETDGPAPGRYYSPEEALAFTDCAARRAVALLSGNDGYHRMIQV